MRRATMITLGLCALLALGGCGKDKDGGKAPEPVSSVGPLDTTEFTGKCKDLLEHEVKVLTPDGAAVVEQIKARVAAKIDAKRCQKGAIPDPETTCLMAAINKGELDACRKK